MKLPIFCLTCAKQRDDEGSPTNLVTIVEIRDDGRYETVCQNGHKSLTILQDQKFEVLFEIGAFAIIDGYYREAVSSFTASLERFYEFVIRSICFHRGLQIKTVDEAWKSVSAQSERQLGAFVFLYADNDRKTPLLTNSQVTFRNEVIHKGKIPTREEAVKYGQAVLNIIRPTLNTIKVDFTEGVQKTVSRHLRLCSRGEPSATMSIGTIIGLSVSTPEHHTRTLETALSDLSEGWLKHVVREGVV